MSLVETEEEEEDKQRKSHKRRRRMWSFIYSQVGGKMLQFGARSSRRPESGRCQEWMQDLSRLLFDAIAVGVWRRRKLYESYTTLDEDSLPAKTTPKDKKTERRMQTMWCHDDDDGIIIIIILLWPKKLLP